jgi:hypothetical protein
MTASLTAESVSACLLQAGKGLEQLLPRRRRLQQLPEAVCLRRRPLALLLRSRK